MGICKEKRLFNKLLDIFSILNIVGIKKKGGCSGLFTVDRLNIKYWLIQSYDLGIDNLQSEP